MVRVLTVTAGVIETVEVLTIGYGYTDDTFQTSVNEGDGIGAEIGVTHKDVASSYVFNSGDEANGFELLDNAAYNTNLLPVVDLKILNCIRYHILRAWWGVIGSANDIAANNDLYMVNLRELKNFTFQLRKPTMAAS